MAILNINSKIQEMIKKDAKALGKGIGEMAQLYILLGRNLMLSPNSNVNELKAFIEQHLKKDFKTSQ